MEIGDYSVWWCPSVRLSFRPLNFCRYLLLGYTTQELHTYTIWSPWSKLVHLKFSDGSRQKFGGNWRKTAKKRGFFCRYLLLGFLLYGIESYTNRELLASHCAPAIFRRIAPNFWRKLAKTKNQIFRFLEILSKALISMPYESFWSEVVHLVFSGRSRQKFRENWRKLAKNRQNHDILCRHFLLGVTT